MRLSRVSGASRWQIWPKGANKIKGDVVGEARGAGKGLTRSCRAFSALLNLAYPGTHMSSV